MAGVAPAVGPPLRRQRYIILGVLLVLAAAGWAVFLTESDDHDMGAGMDHEAMDADETAADETAADETAADETAADETAADEMDADETAADEMAGMAGTETSGVDLSMDGSAALFLAMWTAMMVGMMFPAAAPMILMYARTQRQAPVNTALFTGSYISLWIAFGVLAFALAVGIEEVVEGSSYWARNWGRVGGALIVVAGLYQLTPIKEVCLRHCRTPLAFVMSFWRSGAAGAVRMGYRHALYCAGCCWLIFLVLVPIGMMNVGAMMLIAALVFAEKALPWGRQAARVGAVALVVYGVAVVVQPDLLPTVA